MATCQMTGKKYVGGTKYSLDKRKRQHISSAMNYGAYNEFFKAIRTWGEWSFDWEVLVDMNELPDDNLWDIERQLIVQYDLLEPDKGYNMTQGRGGLGRVVSEETREKHRKDEVHIFYHDDHGIEECTQYSLGSKYDVRLGNLSQLISGKRKSANGWRMTEQKFAQSGENNPAYTSVVYHFHHPVEGVQKMTQHELKVKYDLHNHKGNISLVVNGLQKSVKGWRVIGVEPEYIIQ